MILTDEEELKKLSKGDDTLEHVVREMLHYEAKDIPLGYHDTEEEHRWMMNSIRDRHKEELKEEKKKSLEKGVKKGEAKGIEKTAKAMLLKGYNVEEINDITKIPIDKIKKFKNTITIP